MATDPIAIPGLVPDSAEREGGNGENVVPSLLAPQAVGPATVSRAGERELLLALLGAAVSGASCPVPPPLDERLDWDAMIAIASRGRLVVHLQRGIALTGLSAPVAAREAMKAFRQRALMVNSVNLSTIQRVAAALDDAGLRYVLLKGPLQLRALYGDYFVRPSSDLDLLVEPHAYDRAARTLRSLGYAPAARCETRWWRHYLGEQHFVPPDGSLATVDLHHRVQQPGCPAPRELASYVRGRDLASLGSTRIPVLSRTHACLLAAISFVKAVFHREHSMRYLCDLSAMLRAMTDGERASLERMAEEQGVARLLGFAREAAAMLLPVEASVHCSGRNAPLVDRDLLALVALEPEADTIAWPKRRHLLWHLCDSAGIGGRAGTFAREVLFAAAAEASRLSGR